MRLELSLFSLFFLSTLTIILYRFIPKYNIGDCMHIAQLFYCMDLFTMYKYINTISCQKLSIV